MLNSNNNEQASSHHRRASIKIKHLWSEIKDVLKETHEGLNQAYEVYYGPFRIPQESERRMS